MTEKTWEIGDRFRKSDRLGTYFTGTIVQDLGDGSFLYGRWRVRDKKRLASYGITSAEGLRYATKKTAEAPAPKGTKTQWARLYKRAYEAGLAAGAEAKPVPMLVGTPKDLMGSLLGTDDGGFDETEPVYFVSEGLCGFAWVTVRPGNSSFARWLVKEGKGSAAYGGGVSVWVSEFGQSVARKEKFAGAFAKVLAEAGINAYSESRLD